MDYFYIIVVAIAFIILILLLTFIGIMLQSQYKNTPFPPTSNTCPDGWLHDGSGCKIPDPSGNLSYQNTGIMDARYIIDSCLNNVMPFVKCYGVRQDPSNCYIEPSGVNWLSFGTTATCAQKNWANSYNILWDGVSNYNQC